MAKKAKSTTSSKQKSTKTAQISVDDLIGNFDLSKDAFLEFRTTLDEKERLLFGEVKSREKGDGRANVNDPRVFSQTFERSIRVMSQLPAGKFRGVSADDIGKNILMNLIIEKYVIPHAKSQYPFLFKMRLADWYSLGYGMMPLLVDWVVKTDYIGPDVWLIPIRNIYPQPGVVSFEDMEWCQVETQVALTWIKSRRDLKGWQNIDEFLAQVKDSAGDSIADKSSEDQSLKEKELSSAVKNSKSFPRFTLRTEYRRDRWITYSPATKLILRDIPNPHQNQSLPFVSKYAIALLDFFFGKSEVELSASLQGLINSLYSLAIDDAKMQLYPPLMIDPNSVVLSTIKMGAGQKWLLNDKTAKEPTPFTGMTRGAQSALEMRQMAIGSLQSLAGSSDTSMARSSDASMGKTPQALKMQEARQSARDEIDRFFMEHTVAEVYRRFANLIAAKMPKAITVRLFQREIDSIKKIYPDVETLISKKKQPRNNYTKISLEIPKWFFDNYDFDYEIIPGSTYKLDQEQQVENLKTIIELSKDPAITQALGEKGKAIDVAEAIERLITNSGIQDPDKILVDATTPADEANANPAMESLPADQLPPNPEIPQQITPEATGQLPQVPPQLLQQLPPNMLPQQPVPSNYPPNVMPVQQQLPPMPPNIPMQQLQAPSMQPPPPSSQRDPVFAVMESQINDMFNSRGVPVSPQGEI